MTEIISELIGGIIAMSAWEYAAVLFSVAYLLLAAKQSLWCWLCAFFSSAIYGLLFFNGALLMDSALQLFYIAMAFYGWYSWRNQPLSESGPHNELAICVWDKQKHLYIIAITFVISIIIGYLMDNYTRADFAYLDSLTTCFSIVATYLVARKVLENWLYWIVIDAISIYLYIHKGFYPTTLLFVFYTTMSIWGYMEWRESLSDNEPEPLI